MYKRKRDLMLKEIKNNFPKGVKWTIPKGGMFIWITLPQRINTSILFRKALNKKVAYVVGDAFFPEGGNYNSMRLNFSYSDDEVIKEGIRRLAEVIKEELKATYKKEPFLAEGV